MQKGDAHQPNSKDLYTQYIRIPLDYRWDDFIPHIPGLGLDPDTRFFLVKWGTFEVNVYLPGV